MTDNSIYFTLMAEDDSGSATELTRSFADTDDIFEGYVETFADFIRSTEFRHDERFKALEAAWVKTLEEFYAEIGGEDECAPWEGTDEFRAASSIFKVGDIVKVTASIRDSAVVLDEVGRVIGFKDHPCKQTVNVRFSETPGFDSWWVNPDALTLIYRA